MLTMNAVGLFVTDLKRAVSFYRDVMGMDVKWEWPDYVELFSGTMRMILYSRQNYEKMVSRSFRYPEKLNGTLELSFTLSKFADVDREYARVVEAGARPVFPPTDMEWGQRTSYVADPDGYLIEIGSFNQDEPGRDGIV